MFVSPSFLLLFILFHKLTTKRKTFKAKKEKNEVKYEFIFIYALNNIIITSLVCMLLRRKKERERYRVRAKKKDSKPTQLIGV